MMTWQFAMVRDSLHLVTRALFGGLVALIALIGGLFGVFGQHCGPPGGVNLGRVDQEVQIYMLRHKELPPKLYNAFLLLDDRVVPDRWGNALVFEAPGPDGMRYDIISLGADGQPGGEGADADLRWSDFR